MSSITKQRIRVVLAEKRVRNRKEHNKVLCVYECDMRTDRKDARLFPKQLSDYICHSIEQGQVVTIEKLDV